jgi:hypothetical protein
VASPAKVYSPVTEKVEEIDKSSLGRASEAEGSHELSPAELSRYEAQQAREARAHNPVEGKIAATVGKVRGVGEAFGVATDPLAISLADLGGRGGDVQKYLKDLKDYHGLESGYGELSGQAAGTIAGGEILGAGAPSAATAAGRIGIGAAKAGVAGGLENLIAGSTHDVNETSLGNADLAGEKLYAQMPKHFGVGLAAGTVLGGSGSAAGEALAPLFKALPGKLGAASDAALGREFGGSAELGGQLRTKLGGVPKSAAEVEGLLTAEQKLFREGAAAERDAAKAGLLERQGAETAQQAAKSAEARAAQAKQAQAAIAEIQAHHQTAREALAAQHGEAASNAVKLGDELQAARKQLRTLADDLDKVKGAERVSVGNIVGQATAGFRPDPLMPASPRAMALFQEWAANLEGKTHLGFKETQNLIKSIDIMETRQKVVSGWGNDPEVARAFSSMRDAAKAEFDRASEATAAGVSEAKGLSASRIKESISSLDKAHKEASGNVDNIQKSIFDFERSAKLEARAAERAAASETRGFEAGLRQEDRAFAKGQKAEERALPKASKETPVDTLLGKVKSRPQKEGGLTGAAGMGALVSLLHGNVAGAALSLVGGFAANTAKAEGNLLAARTLRGLADHIASADGSIAKIAGRAVGRYVRQSADKVDDAPKRGEITFEKASKSVRDAQSNPLIIEQRVRTQAGPWAQQAPGVYSSLLSSAMRSQAFLEGKLPPPRTDPYSLTPHLEQDDLSDTEKYDFVQYARACADPLKAMREVVDGDGSPQQVEAVAAVYPGLYAQTKAEVSRYVATLQKPLDYDRAVNIGVLLQMDTSEVMTAEFQSMQSDMYSARQEEEKAPSVSSPRGVNSRLSKSMSSATEQMQSGDV